MAEPDDDTSDTDNGLYYGIKQATEGVVLSNFKVASEIESRWMLDIIEANLPPELNYRGYNPFEHFNFGFDELELRIVVNRKATTSPITSHIINHFELSRKIIDGIRWALRDLISEELKLCSGGLTARDAGLMVLRLLEETTSFIRDYRTGVLAQVSKGKEKHWDLSRTNNINPLLDIELKMKGIDLDSVHGAATYILGKTPAQICRDILPDWRILHCENILRNDLKKNFLHFQQDLRLKLMAVKDIKDLRDCVPQEHRRRYGDGHAAREQLVDYLTNPRISFHGTRRELVPSIVQHGFLKPGDVHPITKQPLSVDNGSVYGRGIYSSPDPAYAMLYSEGKNQKIKPSQLPGLKLVICAVIMGRSARMGWEDNWFEQCEPYPGADSHVNDSQYAYIVFNSAQILPCYVLHLEELPKEDEDDSDKNPWWSFVLQQSLKRWNRSAQKARNPLQESYLPGEKQRRKEQLIAKGQKFFSYGFGPISGKQIVIEDVAEVDDDEEEYGDYQERRIDTVSANSNFWDADWGIASDEAAEDDLWDVRELEGTTAFDEYTSARKAKVNRKNPKAGQSTSVR